MRLVLQDGQTARPLQEKRLFRRLHTGLHADDVAHHRRHLRVQRHHHVHRALVFVLRHRFEQFLQQRPGRFGTAINLQIGAQLGRVVERPGLRRLLHEEIERVVDRHVGHEVDLDLQLPHRLGKDESGLPVAIGILLVVHEVPSRRDLQRMADDPCARMRRRAQADDLRPQMHRTIIRVVSDMVDRGLDRHGLSALRWVLIRNRAAWTWLFLRLAASAGSGPMWVPGPSSVPNLPLPPRGACALCF